MDITMALIKSDMLENLWMIFNFLIIFWLDFDLNLEFGQKCHLFEL
jgi:hypothetical protein